MSKKTSLLNLKSISIIIAVFLMFIASIVITYGEELNLPFNVPTWKQIFAGAELDEVENYGEYPFAVHFIDVGQGDCSLIINETKAILIDGGERENADVINAYLKEQNIEKLDYIIATHPHSDHIGGLIGVIEKVEVEKIIMPALSEKNIPTTKVYADLLNAVNESGAGVYAAVPGDEYICGDMNFTVLAPNSPDGDLNNMSVVIKLDYMGKRFVFTGDAEKESEYEMMDKGFDIKADVLKVGHHGSNTSSVEAFIDMIDPEYAVISCGEGNSYGHPHTEIIDLFKNKKINILRTDLNGNIVIAVNEDGFAINLQKGGD